MMTKGWVKLHRSFLDWEWYSDVNTCMVFLHLILTVSLVNVRWHGIDIPRGARITSYKGLSEELGLSIGKIRTAMQHLESTGEITRWSQNGYTVVWVKTFDHYQSDCNEMTDLPQPFDIPPTTPSQPSDTGLTNPSQRYNNNNNNKNNKNDKKRERDTRAPKLEDVQNFCRETNSRVDPAKFFHYYEANGWKRGDAPIVDWKAMLHVWEAREEQFAAAKPSEDEMTPAEKETMDEYLSLVNRFA